MIEAARTSAQDDIASLKNDMTQAIGQADSLAMLDELRIAILGKKGRVTELMKSLGGLPPEARKSRGADLNVLKDEIAALLQDRQAVLSAQALQQKLAREIVDVTLPARPAAATPPGDGRVHPIAQTMEEILTICASMGFKLAKGPDIESDWYNFEALNFPPGHPARQMQDTFFMPPQDGKPMLLRTHTSSVQIRTMLESKPPLRVIALGRTYRYEHDMTHSPMFHQFEALVVDESTHMGHLKGCVMDILRAFFGIEDLPVRFRPSFFPFTEPSAEIDIGCARPKNGQGELKLGNYGDWLEIGGSGMVHPNVLKNCGIDPQTHQGFAFGWGVERMAMLKYGIPDVRNFFEGDLRWLKHYGFMPFDIPNPALKA